MTQKFNYIIIGGGIVGASTALQLKQRHPDKAILLVEKESSPAQHQTGHNSGVIHAGVYYEPGSLKADFCKRGLADTMRFCDRYSIPYQQCGKIIVATHENELKKLKTLYDNCKRNDLSVEWLEKDELLKREPNIIGIKGFVVKDSAITDYVAITTKMIEEFLRLGGAVTFNSRVIDLQEAEDFVTVETNKDAYETELLVCCAGLQADRVARMIGIKANFRIVPFKGEYFKLPAAKNHIVKHLIYPVPDPDMPFLGVHLTRMIDGSITVGPNAVLGFNREGYKKVSFKARDIANMLTFVGFWKVIGTNLSSGLSEMKNSLWKPGYLKLVQRYCPSLRLADLRAYPPGIRAQAVMDTGELVHDFLFMNTRRSLHVCNAPSPAATAAIPIGEYICNKVEELV